MNHSRAERMPDLWIVHNPWLKNAFRSEREPARPAATSSPRQWLAVEQISHVEQNSATDQPQADLDAITRNLTDLDEQVIAKVCAAVEKHLTIEPADDLTAAVHKAAAVGLAIGFALPRN